MTAEELNTYLGSARVCRVASLGTNGPHVAPLWFYWDGEALWLNSLCRSQRWTDLMNDPRVAVVVDGGTTYDELHGVELKGVVAAVGEVPRTGEPLSELEPVERGFNDKYRGGVLALAYDGRHAWLKLTVEKIASWDFRKIAAS